jgi:hypothetical protein
MVTEQEELQPAKSINIQDDLLVGAMKTRYPFADEVWKSGDLIFIQLEKSTWMVRMLGKDLFSVTGIFDDGQKFSDEGMTQAELENVLDMVYFEENPRDDEVPENSEPENSNQETDFKPLPSTWTDAEHPSAGLAQSQKEGWRLVGDKRPHIAPEPLCEGRPGEFGSLLFAEGVANFQVRHIVGDLADKLDVEDVYFDKESGMIVIDAAGRKEIRVLPKSSNRFDLQLGSKKLTGLSYAKLLQALFDNDLGESVSGNMPVKDPWRMKSNIRLGLEEGTAIIRKKPHLQPPSLKERFLASRACSGIL